MGCNCRMCNGFWADSETFGEFTEPATAPEPPKKSIYDQLSEFIESEVMENKAKAKLLVILEEVDLLDGELNEIQKKLAKRGDGTEAREVASVSEKLY